MKCQKKRDEKDLQLKMESDSKTKKKNIIEEKMRQVKNYRAKGRAT